MAGALQVAELTTLLGEVGFVGVEITDHFDPYGGTSSERVARKFGVTGVNVIARKPG